MNQNLVYLLDELCAGVEIYFTGRTGSQYLKTAFILCDDYSELVSKLFLLTDNSQWTDKKPNNHFKNYPEVIMDVENVVRAKMTPDKLSKVISLQSALKTRRLWRNDFFHSTKLLYLNVNLRFCIEAFCDLFDYGEVLFDADWREVLDSCSNLATYEVMLKLEKRSLSDPSIMPKMKKIFENWPRNLKNSKKKGVHVAEYPEDLHLRLSVTWGGKELLEKLKVLMSP